MGFLSMLPWDFKNFRLVTLVRILGQYQNVRLEGLSCDGHEQFGNECVYEWLTTSGVGDLDSTDDGEDNMTFPPLDNRSEIADNRQPFVRQWAAILSGGKQCLS